jgi:hypothetical protein
MGIKGFAYKPVVRSDLAKLVRNALDGNDGGKESTLSALPMASTTGWNGTFFSQD